MAQGKAVIFCAPSGAGKTTIVKHLISKIPQLKFSVSATTRPIRENVESDGKDYHFLTTDQFQSKIENNELLEWEEVYAGVFYGTLKEEVERIWKSANHVIFDVDVEGGLNLKKALGDKALSVFVSVESVDVLADRLRKRNTDSEESLNRRISKAAAEMEYAPKFDQILINTHLNDAFDQAEKLVLDFIK